MKELLNNVMANKELTDSEIANLVDMIATDSFSSLQLAGLLCSLQTKGPTSSEIASFATHLLSKAKIVDIANALDMCGTGGDKSGTFNISTAVMFVVAAAGVPIAKHGNKAISSQSGSFDVLEELGISCIEDPLSTFEKTGVALLFAPHYHPAFKNVGPLRKELGVRSIFNILGPLLSPAKVSKQLMGVFDPSLVPLIAQAMNKLGRTHAMVVHGSGLDEITISGKTSVSEVENGSVSSYEIDPTEFGISLNSIDTLKVSDKKESAAVIKKIFSGEKSPHRDIVVLNAAAALKVADKVSDLAQGIAMAADLIDSGAAMKKLEELAAL